LVEVENAGAGVTLAEVTAALDGSWQATITLHGAGRVTLRAVVRGSDGVEYPSDTVMITLAPPVQPNTGGTLESDPGEAGRTFTALVALLLTAGGFSAIFAGRLLYLITKNRTH
jgi:hypothetical protein